MLNKLLIPIAVLVALPQLAVAGDINAGRSKAAMCAGCHGENGISTSPIYPNLAGQKAQYLEYAVKAYRDKHRTGGNAGTMYAMVSPLSDDDISDLAAFYASLSGAYSQ